MRSPGWAIDIGTTNTGLARWDSVAEVPRLLELPEICRIPGGIDPLAAPRLIPSVVRFLDRPGRWARLSRRLGVLPAGRIALAGRPALEHRPGLRSPAFAPGFKTALLRDGLTPVARLGRRTFTAREVATEFLREVLREARRCGARPRDLVLTTPVDAFETYRAEWLHVVRSLRLRRLRFLDEPVAAGVGYGLGLTRAADILIVDHGGGTLHLALVQLNPAAAESGRATVLAKEGRPLGGNVVDQWLLEEACARLGYPEPREREEEGWFWRRQMLAEARRAKEALYFDDRTIFRLSPPGAGRPDPEEDEGVTEMEAAEERRGRPRRGRSPWPEFTRDDLTNILRARGLYRELEEMLAAVLSAPGGPQTPEEVEDVLLVGGSTLLPGIYGFFESRFGREKMRAWQPFEAVALGAATYAAGRLMPADHLVHSYAFMTWDAAGKPVYTEIVAAGTRFPTAADHWRGQVRPTCALGLPEARFKLVIAELGRAPTRGPDRRALVWDAEGRPHAPESAGGAPAASGGAPPAASGTPSAAGGMLARAGGTPGSTDGTLLGAGEARIRPATVPTAGSSDGRLAVPLNAADPVLGDLDPPHDPKDRNPRLEVCFGVNAERWLCATVRDLRTGRRLMEDRPVVRLQ